MNDRYLFRAKTRSGLWVQGLLSYRDNKYYISNKARMPFAYEVVEDTICQCTGLSDKNGKLIWENDICIITDGTLDEEDGYFRLDWEIDRAMFEFEGTGICANFDNVSGYDCEVVGNIFDNPELLVVEE